MLHVKFGWILFSGFGEEDFDDGRRRTTDDGRRTTTDDRQMMITKAHLEHSSGELKKQVLLNEQIQSNFAMSSSAELFKLSSIQVMRK